MLKRAAKEYKKHVKDLSPAILRQLEARQLALKYVANVTYGKQPLRNHREGEDDHGSHSLCCLIACLRLHFRYLQRSMRNAFVSGHNC